MQAQFPLTIFSFIIAASRSCRAVALLFVNARTSVHHPHFRAGLAPSLCSCLFPQLVSTPARLQLTIHYLSPSSTPCAFLAPSDPTPSFALLPHPASSSLASPYSMPSTLTTPTSSWLHCNHFTQLHFSHPTTTVLHAKINHNQARAASSSGLTPIRLGVTPKKLVHISFTKLYIPPSLLATTKASHLLFTCYSPVLARRNWLAVAHTPIAAQMLLAHHHTPRGGWEREEVEYT